MAPSALLRRIPRCERIADARLSRSAASACTTAGDRPHGHVARRWVGLVLALAGWGCGGDAAGPAGLVPPPPAPGSLAITVAGLPPGSAASLSLTGPGGFSRAVTGSETIAGLTPGPYTLSAQPATADGDGYSAEPATQGVTVRPGPAVSTAGVAYALATGRLEVTIGGVPAGTTPSVTIQGPNGYSRVLTAAETLKGLAPGPYAVSATALSSGGHTYVAEAAPDTVAVEASPTPAAVAVAYAIATAALTVTIDGLPAGVAAAVTLTGPGVTQALPATASLVGLPPGTYTLSAANVTSGAAVYLPTPVSQAAELTPSVTPVARTVTYARGTGSLNLTVSGLPAGTAAAVTVTGPGGFSQSVTGSSLLSALDPGSYAVAAAAVTSGGQTYTPAPASQSAAVAIGSTVSAAVAYSAPPPTTFNLTIDGMYLTQAAQRYNGTGYLVAGRDAYLRVFALANQANVATPAVRVRLYSGATLLQTSTLVAPGGGVPTSVSQASLTSSWNLAVPGALVQPNLRILADVDPTNAVVESSDADNQFPAGGTPFAMDVRALPTLNLRFVPVLQQVNGLQGNVTSGNQAQFLADLLTMLPVASHDADIRAVYTTTAPALVSDNSNGAWGTVLSEILALRTADASTRYYYGVVKTAYASGVAGIGYVGGGANSSLGWDYLPSGAAVMAHEVGHNMGRFHAPCGGVAAPDPSYPYPGGQIGVWGLDVPTLGLKPPTTTFDLMGYCNPDWVSDYTWDGMVLYRQSNPSYGPPSPSPAAEGLLVWGRVTARGVILEPAFRVEAPITPAAAAGAHRIEGRAAGGTLLFSRPIQVVSATDDRTGPESHFAAVLPLSAAIETSLAELRFVGPEGTASRGSAQAFGPGGPPPLPRDPGPALARPNADQAELRWDAATYPMALVRDPTTGQVLSFARGGRALIWTRAAALDLTFSDGVRTVSTLVRR